MDLVWGEQHPLHLPHDGTLPRKILSLLANLEEECARHHDEDVRWLTTQRIQADEEWSFCGARRKKASEEKKRKVGVMFGRERT